MSEQDATTTVEVAIRGRVASIEDVRAALDVLSAEGIPDSFEVYLWQRKEAIEEPGVPYAERRQEEVLTLRAERRSTEAPR